MKVVKIALSLLDCHRFVSQKGRTGLSFFFLDKLVLEIYTDGDHGLFVVGEAS